MAYIQTSGPTALANRDKELIGHGIEHHKDGFGCPIGYLKGRNLPIEDMTPRDLDAYGIYEGKIATLEFESGVVVEGRVVTGTRDLQGKIILITFDDCSVTYKDRVLFKPEWGAYDMAIGKEVISAFAGPADVNSFEEIGQVSDIVMQKIYYSDSEKKLFNMYSVVREIRESEVYDKDKLKRIFEELISIYPNEWLLPLELYELAYIKNLDIQDKIYNYLVEKKGNPSLEKLIENGLNLIQQKELQNL